MKIVSFFTPAPRVFCAAWALAQIFAGSTEVRGQEGAAYGTPPVKLAEMPERFFQVQDEAGFLWQALDNGALLSGDTQYLQSGLNLIINGEPFAPGEAFTREPGAGGDRIDVRLDEKRSGLDVSRDLWFDTKRSGVRVLDTFANTGKSDLTLSVVLRTTYPFAWQSLHGTGGGVLGSDPSLQLRPGDYSLGIHFSPSEGRHDTFFILGSEKGGQRPEIKASANARELIFTYGIPLPAGQSRSLVHWILQRNLPEVSRDVVAFAPFLQRGQWIEPGIDPARYPTIHNVATTAFPAEVAAPSRLRSLHALNEFTDRLGLHRRADDLLWLGPSSQISGVLEKTGSLTVSTPLIGSVEVPLAEIAAIRGGGGQGLVSMLYLRDGRVYTGAVTKGELKWSASRAPGGAAPAAELLNIGDLHLLLLATASGDGAAPADTTHYLQLANGSTLALVTDPAAVLEVVTPWGRQGIPWGEIVELIRHSTPSPHLRILTKDGSTFISQIPTGTLGVKTVQGQSVDLPSVLVDQLWSPGVPPRMQAEPLESWVDFSELPEGVGAKTGVLLVGNQSLSGELTPGGLTLLDGGTRVRIDGSRIESFQRSSEPDASDRFVLNLSGGEKVEGRLIDDYIRLARQGGDIELPVSQLLAFRKTPTP